MQNAGGLNCLVNLSDRILRKNPKRITFLAPAVTYVITNRLNTNSLYLRFINSPFNIKYHEI
jgi:anaerobic C4-dicarboxylate transporter